MLRIGHGYDVHRLVSGRKLILGGVTIPYELGLDGHSDADVQRRKADDYHSDADVLLHAISDSILGAMAMGDIGVLFPDNDDAFKDADSLELLKAVMAKAEENGYTVNNIDSTILCQRPKLRSYIDDMRKNIAAACRCDISQISVKATTEEGLGFTGKGEGIAAHAVCLLGTV